ncbi:hypothetical protein M431DRAFT_206417 [Trichoderma harzianum CBS 226.95]|uniref:Uncharacterized protein n=1 Tax=Trichoderma harzianum CBS 226.95 TaxID=983964 RepID=A0A2T4AVZ3_TRIHA|nr:hypothetical protein M431DRAFT_206417 [Trichoderma harzianum CBS 226.95]PTB61225.1 hypothetical protein M431DRAFT_206417 [Trichoderma harzianum CBS 226.95]
MASLLSRALLARIGRTRYSSPQQIGQAVCCAFFFSTSWILSEGILVVVRGLISPVCLAWPGYNSMQVHGISGSFCGGWRYCYHMLLGGILESIRSTSTRIILNLVHG